MSGGNQSQRHDGSVAITLALKPNVVDALFTVFEPLIPEHAERDVFEFADALKRELSVRGQVRF